MDKSQSTFELTFPTATVSYPCSEDSCIASFQHLLQLLISRRFSRWENTGF